MQWKNSYSGSLSSNETVTCSARDNSSINYVCGYNESYTFISKFDNTGALVQTIEYVDENNTKVIPQSIFVDNSSNIYLVTKDAIVLKFNSAGNLTWENKNTTYTSISVEASIVDNSSNPNFIYYTGSFNSFLGVIKVNANTGATTWSNYLNPIGNNYSKAYDIAYNGGNVYVTGLTNSSSGDAVYTVKLNSLGTTQYQYTGTFGISETSLRLEVNTSGDAFVFGKTSSTGREEVYLRKITNAGLASWTTITDHTAPNDISSITAIDLAANPSYTSFFMVYKAIPPPNTFISQLCEFTFGINSSGTIINNASNTSFYPQPVKVKSDNSGNFYVIGTLANGTRSMYTTKYNSFLNSQFLSSYMLNNLGSATNAPSDIFFDNSGNSYVSATGYFNSTNVNDAVIVKYNQSGTLNWENVYDGKQNAKDYASKLFLSKNNTHTISFGEIESNFTGKDIVAKMHDLQGHEIWSALIDVNLKADVLVKGDKDANDNLFIQFTNFGFNQYLTLIDSIGNQGFSNTIPYRSKGFYLNKVSSEVFLGNENLVGSDEYEIRSYMSNGNANFIHAGNVNANFNSSCDDIWQDGSGNIYAIGSILNTSLSSRTIQAHKYKFFWRIGMD